MAVVVLLLFFFSAGKMFPARMKPAMLQTSMETVPHLLATVKAITMT